MEIMNRRSLLAYILAAPVVGVAAALPRPTDPVKLAGTAGREISAKPPFIFSGGTLYLNEVRCDSLSALSACLGSVDISDAHINNLIVGCSPLR
jgi:hypothetical protein